MANEIKLKRGSGSDPGASDLVVGEIAIRTDTGKLFTKKDDNSVAEISGGGISDGDKGDITVSSSGATFTIDNGVVTYAKIQNVSATNRILGRDSSGAGVIEEITPANLRTMLNVADGATNVTNTNQLTNGAGFITATLTNEQVQDIVGGMVTGNTETGITVTYQDGDGTLDFVVGTLNQDTTGNAATATALETARNIGGVSFDGTGNINLPGVNTTGNQDTTGNAATADGVDVSGVSTNSDLRVLFTTNNVGAGRTIGCDSSDDKFVYNPSSNTLTVDTVVASLTGNVTGNTSGSSGSCTGNAATATALQTARTIAGVSFDGTANISLNNNAITNGAGYITATLTNEQVQDIVGGMLTGNTETGITVTYQDSDGTIDFVVGTLNQDTTGTSGGFTAGNASNLNSGTIPDGRFPATLPAISGANLTNLPSSGLPLSGGELTGDLITHQVKPDGNNTRSLGTSSNRWSDVFTNDLHLSNKGGANQIDNSWGDFTIQEGIEDLYLINNRNGKMYKFVLQEVG